MIVTTIYRHFWQWMFLQYPTLTAELLHMSLYSRFAPALVLPVLLAMLSACGGGGGAAGPGQAPLPAPPEPVSVALPGLAVLKVRAIADHWVAMAGTPRAIADVTIPERRLRIGAAAWQPPGGWSLVDFALHPSGETSACCPTAPRCVSCGWTVGVRC